MRRPCAIPPREWCCLLKAWQSCQGGVLWLWGKLMLVDLAGCWCSHGCAAGDVTAEREEVESCSQPPSALCLTVRPEPAVHDTTSSRIWKRWRCFSLDTCWTFVLAWTWKSCTVAYRGCPREGEGDGGGAVTQVGATHAVWLTFDSIFCAQYWWCDTTNRRNPAVMSQSGLWLWRFYGVL